MTLNRKEIKSLHKIISKSRKGTINGLNDYVEQIAQFIANYRNTGILPPFKWLKRMIKVYDYLIKKNDER